MGLCPLFFCRSFLRVRVGFSPHLTHTRVLIIILLNFHSIESSWGVYQAYFSNSQILGPIQQSELAWVGSIQATGQPLVGL